MRLIAGLATLLSILGFATGVSAHASLVGVEPGDGSVLAQAPKTVQLQFNEPVTPAAIKLIDAAGKARDDALVQVTDNTIVVTLPENLPRGTQLISYRVISEDGHPVAGSTVFSIGATTANAEPQASNVAVAALIWLTRIGVYLGLFVGVGGALFAAWIAPASAGSNLIVAALIAGLFSAAASLGLGGLDLLNAPLSSIANPEPWRAAAGTSAGPSLAIAIAAMVAAFAASRSGSVGVARTLSALATAGVGLSLASSGHAATAPPQWLTRPAMFLHGVGVAYWIGALVPLAALAWKPATGLLAVLTRFSRGAVVVVGLLVFTGLALAIVQLESFGALIETQYGLILLIKLTLVVMLLALAALNRFRLTPALAADPLNTRPLLRSVLVECVLAVGILAVVAGWRFTPPPRALAATVVTPLAIHIHTDKAMFQVLISPGAVGTDSFVLQLMNGEGSPLTVKEATLTLSLPERGIEPFERPAALGADGYWHLRAVPIPYPGRWHLRIDALVTDFEKITLEDDFDVPPRQ
jgi:copper transport protein